MKLTHISINKRVPLMLHHVRNHHRRTPRHPNLTMDQHLPSLQPRLLHPSHRLRDGRPERRDAVVRDGLHVEDFDPAGLVFVPKSVVGSGLVMGSEGRSSRVEEGAFTNGDDVGDTESMEHERVGSVEDVAEVEEGDDPRRKGSLKRRILSISRKTRNVSSLTSR
jgi:hypothetical protein